MQKKIILILLAIFFSNLAIAENNYYLMLKNNKVNVRYGPGFDYPIKFIYIKKFLPIKVIDKKENFRRIVDIENNSGWIHTSQLRKNKSFILKKNQILFSKPTQYSKPIITIAKGRLLLIKKCKKKWCRVKTEKYIGWLKAENIWGNIN